jgi:hypothetical protein
VPPLDASRVAERVVSQAMRSLEATGLPDQMKASAHLSMGPKAM